MRKPFRLRRDTLGLIIRAIPLDKGRVDLILEEANEEILAAIQKNGDIDDPLHRSLMPASNLYHEINEWLEIILRIKYMPYIKPYLMKQKDVVYCSMLQYINVLKDWFFVEVKYHDESGYGKLAFKRLSEVKNNTLLRQLMSLSQYCNITTGVLNGGMWTLDCIEQNIYLSNRMAKITGFGSYGMVIPMAKFLGRVHPQDLDRVVRILDGIETSITDFFVRYILPDGKTVHMCSHASALYDDNGRLIRIFGLSEDVSRQIQNENHLAVSNIRFEKVVQNSNDLFFITNSQGRCIYTAPSTADILGIESWALIGRRLGNFILRTKNEGSLVNEIRDIIENQKKKNFECQIRVKGYKYRWYRFSVFPMESVDGVDFDMVGIGHDITDEKEREGNLRFFSTHDVMTGKYNRSHFWTVMNDLSQRRGRNYSLVLLDINGLRMINDAFGLKSGDQMIVDLSEALTDIFPNNENIFRIGGDEFAVILEGLDAEETEEECQKITAFSRSTMKKLLPINLSWGSAANDEVQDVHELFKMAERRMFDNKLLQEKSFRNHVVVSLKEALKSRNAETSDHMLRMEYMVSKLGKRLGLALHDYDRLILLASMHDVGKLGIPDYIINKPGPLSEGEWKVMRTHAQIGYRIATSSQELSGIATEILHHHERWDGSGYPDGKKGDEIPLLAQIISVVDTYDVITNKRVYKNKIRTHEEAISELKRCMGTQFSPHVTELFLNIFNSPVEENIKHFV